MNAWIELILNITNLGLIYALVVLGVHISSMILKIDDLTTEGSFATGGALSAIMVAHGCPSLLGLIAAGVVGALIGALTGVLHTKLGLNSLISGLVMTTALFSVNLKMAGANVVMNRTASLLTNSLISNTLLAALPVLILISIGILLLVAWLLRTEIGYLLKAVGSNAQMVRIMGKNVDGYVIAGLALANCLTAVSGMLMVQYTGFWSITGNIGTLVTALAGLMIGSALCKRPLAGVLLGAVIYQAIIAVTIELNIDPSLNKLITAALMVLLMVMRTTKK